MTVTLTAVILTLNNTYTIQYLLSCICVLASRWLHVCFPQQLHGEHLGLQERVAKEVEREGKAVEGEEGGKAEGDKFLQVHLIIHVMGILI